MKEDVNLLGKNLHRTVIFRINNIQAAEKNYHINRGKA